MSIKTIIIILTFGIGALGVNGIRNAIQNYNAEQAAQQQMELIKSQELLSQLPDAAQTLILTLGALYGMNTFGPKVLLAAGVTFLGGLAVLIIALGQMVTLLTRPTQKDAYRYSFYTSCLVAGVAVIAGGFLLANVPGGAELFRSLVRYGVIFAFFAMGGGFGLRFSGGKYSSETNIDGVTTTKAEAPGFDATVSGRGRTNKDSESHWKTQ